MGQGPSYATAATALAIQAASVKVKVTPNPYEVKVVGITDGVKVTPNPHEVKVNAIGDGVMSSADHDGAKGVNVKVKVNPNPHGAKVVAISDGIMVNADQDGAKGVLNVSFKGDEANDQTEIVHKKAVYDGVNVKAEFYDGVKGYDGVNGEFGSAECKVSRIGVKRSRMLY